MAARTEGLNMKFAGKYKPAVLARFPILSRNRRRVRILAGWTDNSFHHRPLRKDMGKPAMSRQEARGSKDNLRSSVQDR